MGLTKEQIHRIAKESETYNDFSWNLIKATEPYKSIRSAKIGEYVRIKSKTYGRKTPYEFTSPPDEGKIIKINPKSVTVKVATYEKGKENMKYPEASIVSDDLSILRAMMEGQNKDTFWNSYWMKISGRKPRKHDTFDLNDIIARQQKRTKRSIAMDSQKTAKNTISTMETDKIWKWMKHPNRFDIFNIDTKHK